MSKFIVLISLAFATSTNFKNLSANVPVDVHCSLDKLANNIILKIFSRAFKVWPIRADLSNSTLGQNVQLAPNLVPFHTIFQSRDAFVRHSHLRPRHALRRTASRGTSQATQMPKPTDQYLSGYGALHNHLAMLRDHERMKAYHDAIKLNAEVHFKGKIVLDVGCGTGILAIWAAQAGALRVYAAEGSSIHVRAKEHVAAHDLQAVVKVLHGRIEDLELPEKVDVIVSEWMGYFLLRESMVQSVLVARDRWLKPNGVMYPSSARMFMTQLDDPGFADRRMKEIEDAMVRWDDVAKDLGKRYSLKFDQLRQSYYDEHFTDTFRQAWLGDVPGSRIAGEAQLLLDIDMHTVTNEQLFGWKHTMRLPQATNSTPVRGLCGWFDVWFCGRHEVPATNCINLTTAPTANATHWGQTALLLQPPLTSPDIVMELKQSARLHHDLNVTLRYDETVASYEISNDFRGYSEYDLRTASDEDEDMEFDYSPMDDDRDYNNDVSGDWEAQSFRMVGSFNEWNESGPVWMCGAWFSHQSENANESSKTRREDFQLIGDDTWEKRVFPAGDNVLQLGKPCPAVHSRHQHHGHGRNFAIDVSPGATYRVVYDQKARQVLLEVSGINGKLNVTSKRNDTTTIVSAPRSKARSR